MSSTSYGEEEELEGSVESIEDLSSGEDPPMSEWSSLQNYDEVVNQKKLLYSKGLYSPGNGALCESYIPQSDSQILLHNLYNYPAILDPGIKQALLAPEPLIIYEDDGQSLYLALCEEMNICPVRLFHRNLLSNDINLNFYCVSPKGVKAMAKALRYNKFVKSFNLTDNFLNDDACYHLGDMLRSNVTLKELNLAGCRIGGSGLVRLGRYMHENNSIELLNLAKNNIGDEGGMYFAKMIFKGIPVKRVSLSKNELGRLSAIAIAESFEYKDKITHLDLSWNSFFQVPSITKLLNQLAQSGVLKEVNLSWNFLEGERVAESIKRMMQIPTLSMLDLSHNRFMGKSIVIITSFLIKAKKLVTLDLSDNPMTPTDAFVALEKMLRPRVKLANLLMTNVWVNQTFLILLANVKRLKCRKNFFVTFGGILNNWMIHGADARELVLRRADYLCSINKKNPTDVALFFLTLAKEKPNFMAVDDIVAKLKSEHIPIDAELINELSQIFRGPKAGKKQAVNMQELCDFMQRIWPKRKLPPPPPPEPKLEIELPESKSEPKPIPEPIQN